MPEMQVKTMKMAWKSLKAPANFEKTAIFLYDDVI
jgi:hypothetical protein